MGKRILVVEGDASNRAFLSIALQDEGYDVTSVGNGQEALKSLETCCPNLIILDMWTPVMDGMSFLSAYNAIGGQVPVVALSTSGRTERMARSLGVRDFLIKPLDLDILLNTVKRYIA
jgi:CheY-like chemotaxis protein